MQCLRCQEDPISKYHQSLKSSQTPCLVQPFFPFLQNPDQMVQKYAKPDTHQTLLPLGPFLVRFLRDLPGLVNLHISPHSRSHLSLLLHILLLDLINHSLLVSLFIPKLLLI